jgi:hypothetical protein
MTQTIKNHNKRVKNLIRKDTIKMKNHSKNAKLANLYRPFIKNYSNVTLSDIQIIALTKGFKHILTPKHPHRTKLTEDFDNFARKMRVSYIMHDKDKKIAPFKPKSEWVPIDSENNKLEGYLEQTKYDLCHLRFNKPEPNITKEERQALNELEKKTQHSYQKT